MSRIVIYISQIVLVIQKSLHLSQNDYDVDSFVKLEKGYCAGQKLKAAFRIGTKPIGRASFLVLHY